jgi:hypothetical protein
MLEAVKSLPITWRQAKPGRNICVRSWRGIGGRATGLLSPRRAYKAKSFAVAFCDG